MNPQPKGQKTKRIKPRRVKNPAHLAKVASLPCVICQRTPVEVHHVRIGVGMGQRASDLATIALCAAHHRTGGPQVAFHAGPREWEAIYGTQAMHLEDTLILLGVK